MGKWPAEQALRRTLYEQEIEEDCWSIAIIAQQKSSQKTPTIGLDWEHYGGMH